MTTPTPRPDDWRRRLGPERVAAIVAAIVVVLGSLAVASTIGASEGSRPLATLTPGDGAPLATAHPFAAQARFALAIHERLVSDTQALATELARSELRTGVVVATVRRLNNTAHIGADVSGTLARVPGSLEVGRALLLFYGAVAGAADETLNTPVRDRAGYRVAAERLLVALEPTASLQDRLDSLIASTRPTPSVASIPTASPIESDPGQSPTPSRVPAATPTPAATPPPSAPPATVRPSGLPLVGLVRNPGFEAADPDPWTLVVEPPAAAALSVDTTATPFEGAQSGRVDIRTPSAASTGISLRQTGIAVAQGHRYACRIALRAETVSDVRVRVTSASGATYATRVVTVGPSWTVVEFEFGAFVQDPAATLQVDLGHSAKTTWVDAGQITDVTASAP